MTLLACGINHKTASLALREQAVITKAQQGELLSELLSSNSVFEAVILSTCNRTEIYADGEDSDILLYTLAQYSQLDIDQLQDVSYHYSEQDVVRHIMRVASGLDSMILGEPQIFGQLKEAVNIAQQHNALGPQLSQLFQQVFNVTKKIRTNTEVGACPISVASTAIKLAEEVFPQLQQAQALLIGAGDTTTLMAKHLAKKGVTQITIASRSLEKAQQLATTVKGLAISLDQLDAHLAQMDIIFSATASNTPVVSKHSVCQALAQRNDRELFMVDIAMPRDIEESVAELDSVHLYNIDDLKSIIELNSKSREHAAAKAEEMIVEQTQHYMQWLRSLGSTNTICAFRSWVEELRKIELEKAYAQLQAGTDPSLTLNRFANSFSNKLMHPPSIKIREASQEGRTDFIKHFHQLFDLDAEQ